MKRRRWLPLLAATVPGTFFWLLGWNFERGFEAGASYVAGLILVVLACIVVDEGEP